MDCGWRIEAERGGERMWVSFEKRKETPFRKWRGGEKRDPR